MRAYTKVLVSFAILVLTIFGIYVFTNWFSKVTGYTLGEDEKTRLASCLSEKSVLYLSPNCFDCEDQLEIFGVAAELLKIKSCTSVEKCPDLKGFPAWNIEGKTIYGKKSLQELIEASGCTPN